MIQFWYFTHFSLKFTCFSFFSCTFSSVHSCQKTHLLSKVEISRTIFFPNWIWNDRLERRLLQLVVLPDAYFGIRTALFVHFSDMNVSFGDDDSGTIAIIINTIADHHHLTNYHHDQNLSQDHLHSWTLPPLRRDPDPEGRVPELFFCSRFKHLTEQRQPMFSAGEYKVPVIGQIIFWCSSLK